MAKQGITLLLALTLAGTAYWGLDLDAPLRTGLAILLAVATLWVGETFHITITALLIPVLTVIGGLFDVAEALKNFAHPIIFLFLGGFALAATLRQQGLDRYLATSIMRLAGGRFSTATLLLFLTSAVLSMWISNTATTAMMLPLALGLLAPLDYKQQSHTYVFVLLGTAYSASIGGIATLVGSPPNAIAAAAVNISFTDWLAFGLPSSTLMLPLAWAVLYLLLRPDLSHRFAHEQAPAALNKQQYLSLAVFVCTVSLWLFSEPLARLFAIDGNMDALIALGALICVAALRLAQWKSIEAMTDWGVLLLFGGGLTLSAMLKTTGTSVFLAEGISGFVQGTPLIVFLLVVVGFIVLLTEIASNTASAALLIPVFISIAQAMGLSPVVLAVVVAIATSCAFMLPVATPPNALVYGSGYIPQAQMLRVGLALNITLTFVISLAAWYLL